MDGASPYAIHTKRLFELLGLDPETGRYAPKKPVTSPPKPQQPQKVEPVETMLDNRKEDYVNRNS